MTRHTKEAQRSPHRREQRASTDRSGAARGNTVHCPSCHRREHWADGARAVALSGGSRRPSIHPELAAWRTVLAAHRGETAPVVCACSGCDQPMIGDAEPISWTIHTPEGDLIVDGTFMGPSGPLTEADAAFWVEEQLREQRVLKPGLWLFQASVMSTMLVPLTLWAFALVCFITFIINFGRGS